jgi:hypothetical protein
VLLVFAILFGIFPYQFPGGTPSVLEYMNATINKQVADLDAWTRRNHPPKSAAPAAPPATATLPSPAAIPVALNDSE